MRKALKVIVALVIITFINLGAAPWIDGYFFKKTYQHELTLLQTAGPYENLKLTVVEYQNGWLSSRAKIRIEYVNSIPMAGITIEQDITHGPLVYDSSNKGYTTAMARIQSRFYPDIPVDKYISSTQNHAGVMQADSIATFDKKLVSQISSPSFIIPMDEKSTITWEGFSGTGTIAFTDVSVKQLTFTISIGALKATRDGNVVLSSAKLVCLQNWILDPTGLWTGKISLSQPDFAINDLMAATAHIENLNLSNESRVENSNLFSNDTHITFDKFEIPDLIVAPFSLKYSINNLDAKSLLNLIAMQKQFQMNQQRPDEPQITSALAHILTPKSNGKIDLDMNTPQGALTLNAEALWPENTALPTTLEEISKNFVFHMDVRVASALVNKLIDMSATKIQSAIKPHDQMSLTSSAADIIAQQNAAQDKLFNQKIAELVQQNVLSLNIALQLMELEKEHAPAAGFAANIDKLVNSSQLSAQGASQIKQIYSQLTFKQAPPPEVAAASANPADEGKKQISDWIQQGYIKQDKDDYVINMTHQNGATLINGLPLQGMESTTTQSMPPQQMSPPPIPPQ